MPHALLKSLKRYQYWVYSLTQSYQTTPEARALSWRLARYYIGGPKLVYYNYTTLFIYSTSYKLVQPYIVLLGLQSAILCVLCVSLLSCHSLALIQSSDSGPDSGFAACTLVNDALHMLWCHVLSPWSWQPVAPLLSSVLYLPCGILRYLWPCVACLGLALFGRSSEYRT